jgi:maltooligosyltrehalose trehalohydrolase
VLGVEALALRFRGDDPRGHDDRLLLMNLGTDLELSPIPEPLLAPPGERGWRLCWSSEETRYGGDGAAALVTDDGWVLPGATTLVLAPEDTER